MIIYPCNRAEPIVMGGIMVSFSKGHCYQHNRKHPSVQKPGVADAWKG